MKNHRLYLLYLCLPFFFGCNPFPKKDTHPEILMISDLLKDKAKFRKVSDMTNLSEIVVLKDDRILLKPNKSEFEFKIIDAQSKLIFKAKYDWNLPFYIDEHGNLYFDRKKYIYPSYANVENFKTVVFRDSIQNKLDVMSNLSDSLRSVAVDNYERNLLKPYGLIACDNALLKSENCDVFEIRNNALIVRQSELFKIAFTKIEKDILKFDNDVLIKWRNGRIATPVYLSYYQFGQLKFKCEDTTFPKAIRIEKGNYIYSSDFGLYEVL